MSSFTDALTVTSLDADCERWRTEQPFRYEVRSLGSGLIVEVPPGFETDAASIPGLLRPLIPSWGRYSRAAVIHDYLYDCLRRGRPHRYAPTRKAADDIFYEAMIAGGTNRIVACAFWLAVRVFGARRIAS